jgi:hypothetical protein
VCLEPEEEEIGRRFQRMANRQLAANRRSISARIDSKGVFTPELAVFG